MELNYWRRVAVLGLLILCLPGSALGQAPVEKNVVYGMYSGSALLLDVHYPSRSNGLGIIFIAGSGWNAGLSYSATPLKESPQVEMYVPSLTQAGYTVFTITHRGHSGISVSRPCGRRPACRPFHQTPCRKIRHQSEPHRRLRWVLRRPSR